MVSISQLFDLTDKVALVTGGAKGIGAGIVMRLAEAGARVVIADVDEAAANRTAAEVGKKGRVIFARTDLANVKDAEGAVAKTLDAFQRIDIAVNNAGIFPMSPALKTTEELWDRVLDINLKAAFFVAQAAARKMVEAGTGGSIVNIASIDALHPTGNLVHYDASKGGMLMMTKSLALELAKSNVRVNTICPGAIHTPGADETMKGSATAMGTTADQMRAAYAQRIPMQRMGEPDDIARAVLFFASPASSYVTGAHLVVDGGWLLV